MKFSTMVCAAALVAIGCARADAQTFRSSAGDLAVETKATGLDHPWAFPMAACW